MSNQIVIDQPFYILSRKEYASGEKTIEALISDNKTVHANLTLTFKDNPIVADSFKLGKEYQIIFIEKED